MDFRIKGKTALVSGGSKGIGLSSAQFLAAEGCKVALVARGQEAIDSAVAGLRDSGGTAIGISADLTTAEGVAVALEKVREAFGAPDIVVSQTNDIGSNSFYETEDEQFEEIFKLFTVSTIRLARATIPAMQEKKWGRFIHIGSSTTKEHFARRQPHILAFTARPSTVGFLKGLAEEVAADGVTVNTVAPGFVLTDSMAAYFMKGGISREEIPDYLLKSFHLPSKRLGEPEEVGSLIAFLCSGYAGYINGNWIVVDGNVHRSIL